jgi:hypothetical protein
VRRAAALAALACWLGACGGGGDGGQYGDLIWVGQPILERPRALPADRVVIGRVRNKSIRVLRLRAREMRLVDGDGRTISGDVLFLTGFLHGLAPPTRAPKVLPESAQLRLGLLAKIPPGGSVPINVAWRIASGRDAAAVAYPGGRLPIPDGPVRVLGR